VNKPFNDWIHKSLPPFIKVDMYLDGRPTLNHMTKKSAIIEVDP